MDEQQCVSVELLWGTRCERAAGHESSIEAKDRIHRGKRGEYETITWGEPGDIRKAVS